MAYLEREPDELRVYALGVSLIKPDVQAAYLEAKTLQNKIGVTDLLLPLDHLATRVYSQNREVAILEYLSLTSYYFWGAYNFKDQNSSPMSLKVPMQSPNPKAQPKYLRLTTPPILLTI